ncbi:unnamed protein product [Taenia asiatica]|uniref:Expressed conserved protein n=1 Tax=Taenia asiatica TaxID=60517 RepID=A0A0R3W9Q5_TAEAS|nr:unnamed protein product [Taenia asiatica]
MAPLLSTAATCVCCNTPLEGKSLRDVAVHGLRKAENPPSYTVKLTKSKLSFKPASKGVKKLKPIELREVDDTYVIEESDVVAFSFKNEKKKKKKKKKEKSKKSQKGKVSEEKKPESNSEPPHKRPSKSSLTLSDVEAPQQSRRTSSPRKFHDEGSGGALSPPVKAESSVCSHCHQKLPNRILASRIEYDPQNYMPSRSPRSRARSYDFSLGGSNGSVCYIGPRSSIKKSYQPSFTGRNRVPYHRTHIRASPSDTRTDEGDGSSFTSTTPSFKDGHFIRVGAITCRTPKPQRRSSQFKKTAFEPTSKRQDLKSSKSQSIVYYIWDSSGDEEDESDDYESNPTSTDESVSSYDSAPSFASTRSKKIEKLLHELGKPGAIRLY